MNLNLNSFNLLCTRYQHSGTNQIFFQSKNHSVSYQTLMHHSLVLAKKLEGLKDNFLAIKLSDPYVVFCYSLAALMSGKRLLILSAREPAQLSQSHANHIPFDQIIEDHHELHHNLESGLLPEQPLAYQCQWPLEEPFLFILSSGSSGKPKGIGHSLSTLSHSAESIINFLGMGRAEKTFLNLPVNHVGGLMILWRSFFSGGIVLTDEADFDYISLVPVLLKRNITEPSKLERLKKAKAILVGGSKLSLDLKNECQDLGLRLFETYGMTETASLIMINGLPLPGQTIKLAGNGCFKINGPTLSPGFFRNKIYYPLFRDEDNFYQTFDKGLVNEAGQFQFIERIDLNFKSGGELISPMAIEQIVKENNWITDCVLVPVPHYQWTEAGCLFFETNSTIVNADELLKKYLKDKCHPFSIPKFFIEHNFSSTGIKPSRFELKQAALKKCLLDKFNYHLVPASVGQKKLVVFLHGFLGELYDLAPMADQACDQLDTAKLFIDLPGHGKTDIKKFKEREEVFFELAQLINHFCQGADLYLYGYSMGGRIALELANQYLKVKKVFLESASFGLNTESDKLERANSESQLFDTKPFSIDAFLTEWYKNPIFHNYNKSKSFADDMSKKKSHDFNQWQLSLNLFSPAAGLLLDQQLAKIQSRQTKITVFAGAEDKKYISHYRDIMKNFALDLVMINEAGHNPHRTHLHELVRLLKERLPV